MKASVFVQQICMWLNKSTMAEMPKLDPGLDVQLFWFIEKNESNESIQVLLHIHFSLSTVPIFFSATQGLNIYVKG